jgi:hypothetical protein
VRKPSTNRSGNQCPTNGDTKRSVATIQEYVLATEECCRADEHDVSGDMNACVLELSVSDCYEAFQH